jgi:hypothetical protein
MRKVRAKVDGPGGRTLREPAAHRRSERSAQEALSTLPLFGEPRGPRIPLERSPRPMAPMALALHAYWSASVEAQALFAAAAHTELPSERRALLALQRIELGRKETARRLLREVWRVKIPGAEGADPASRVA